MKKTIRKVLSLVLALAFVFSLAACGGAPSSAPAASGSAPASGSEPAAPADPTTLKVYTWWDVTKFEHLQKMQQDFEAANPDIKLEFVTIPSKYADTMVTKLAGGEIPDVMMLAMDQVPRYALNGMLLPLDDLASQEYKDALYPVVKDALTVNGTMYAAARDVTPKVMYLNTKMFEDAGIEIPADTWTMDEFVEIAKQLTKGSGADAQWGYYWANYTDQTFAMIAAFGGELYSEDGKASVLSTDENTQKAVQFMYDLYNTYKVCPSATQAAQFGDSEFAPFMANKVAMQIGALSTASTFDANGTEYTVLPMPYVDGVSKTSSFVNTWVIPKTARESRAFLARGGVPLRQGGPADRFGYELRPACLHDGGYHGIRGENAVQQVFRTGPGDGRAVSHEPERLGVPEHVPEGMRVPVGRRRLAGGVCTARG